MTVFLVLIGFGIGVIVCAIAMLIASIAGRPRTGRMPAATARQLRRVRRANRLEIRRDRMPVRFVSPPRASFDDGETHD
ncbi:MAG TPA: hypothetical protein VJU58_13775 [Microbacterium sp.]|nr:hypothetical protein [Microbacterium sp.]